MSGVFGVNMPAPGFCLYLEPYYPDDAGEIAGIGCIAVAF